MTSRKQTITWIAVSLFTGTLANVLYASHSLGPVLAEDPPRTFGPGIGTADGNAWESEFTNSFALFLMLHFMSDLDDADQLDIVSDGVVLQTFRLEDGDEFWVQPVAGDTVTIIYRDNDGDGNGSVTLDRYGRGQNVDLFLTDTGVTEPPLRSTGGICNGDLEPSWQNVACLDLGDPRQSVMATVARSCGMIVMENRGSGTISSCSATLIDPDLILTAAHCLNQAEMAGVKSGYFTLDFATDCLGFTLPSEPLRFFKVVDRLQSGYERDEDDGRLPLDYAIAQIRIPPTGVGAPPITLNATPIAVGDEVFVIHHPTGRMKKVSRPGLDPCTVNGIGTKFSFGCDLDNGSSGSAVFDMDGEIVGVSVNPGGCSNRAVALPAIITDLGTEPPPARDVDVMIAFDRSGSMGWPAVDGDDAKIEQARLAAATFVDLIDSDAEHRVGLVSFSTTPMLEEGLRLADSDTKTLLAGPPPSRDGGKLSLLMADQRTSIGGALQVSQDQFPPLTDGANRPVILLMTDGLENEDPWIDDVDLEETLVCAVGFGSERNLNGPLLTQLAIAQNGRYTRASDGLELQKFFVLCFGQIFNTAFLVDPILTIPSGQFEPEAPVEFQVCDETSLTVVAGWERQGAGMELVLTAPSGRTIDRNTPGAGHSGGRTWMYFRLTLPFEGERAGLWKASITRSGGVEFPPLVDDRVFISAIADGGPIFNPAPIEEPVYTGDLLNPLVVLRETSGVRVPARVDLSIRRPLAALGEILSEQTLEPEGVVNGDPVDARTATLSSIETQVPFTTDEIQLFDDGEHGDGGFEPDGVFGNVVEDLTRYEGHYTFQARAVFEEGCQGIRETAWSIYVQVGIDASNTVTTSTLIETLPDETQRLGITLTPKDRFGTRLGPGRGQSFSVAGASGSTLDGDLTDNGDGTYTQNIFWDPSSPESPGILISQPARDDVLVSVPTCQNQCGCCGSVGFVTMPMIVLGMFCLRMASSRRRRFIE